MLVMQLNPFLRRKLKILCNGVGSAIGRASDCGSECCGFKSHPSPHMQAQLSWQSTRLIIVRSQVRALLFAPEKLLICGVSITYYGAYGETDVAIYGSKGTSHQIYIPVQLNWLEHTTCWYSVTVARRMPLVIWGGVSSILTIGTNNREVLCSIHRAGTRSRVIILRELLKRHLQQFTL